VDGEQKDAEQEGWGAVVELAFGVLLVVAVTGESVYNGRGAKRNGGRGLGYNCTGHEDDTKVESTNTVRRKEGDGRSGREQRVVGSDQQEKGVNSDKRVTDSDEG
jgi:hypothetical protein